MPRISIADLKERGRAFRKKPPLAILIPDETRRLWFVARLNDASEHVVGFFCRHATDGQHEDFRLLIPPRRKDMMRTVRRHVIVPMGREIADLFKKATESRVFSVNGETYVQIHAFLLEYAHTLAYVLSRRFFILRDKQEKIKGEVLRELTTQALRVLS